jgi:hypothetical protein
MRLGEMKLEPGIESMSKTMLLSELNALNYSNWTQADQLYRDRLLDEYNKRIEEECKLATQEG